MGVSLLGESEGPLVARRGGPVPADATRGERGGVGDRSDVKMIRGEGLLAKDPTVGIVCIRAALILGRARELLQKC